MFNIYAGLSRANYDERSNESLTSQIAGREVTNIPRFAWVAALKHLSFMQLVGDSLHITNIQDCVEDRMTDIPSWRRNGFRLLGISRKRHLSSRTGLALLLGTRALVSRDQPWVTTNIGLKVRLLEKENCRLYNYSSREFMQR